MKEVLAQADIVTLHVPENASTKNLINKNVLRQFKHGSILINYARGEVVDLDALQEAIKEERITGAAI
jgi:D-3-phosphoglycerate dehydrogenase